MAWFETDVTQVRGLVSERNRLAETLKELVGALQDAKEGRNPSVAHALAVKAKAEALLKELGVV